MKPYASFLFGSIAAGCIVLGVTVAAFSGRAADGGSDAAERRRVAQVTRPTTDFSKPEDYELRPGGAATMFGPFNQDAFSAPSANMSFARRADFSVGNGVFRKLWVSAPSSTTSSDGLGPLFNARGCQSCHLKDGRGHPPPAGRDDPAASMVMALSLPSGAPVPVYGHQFQTLGVAGIPAEGQVRLTYSEVPVRFDDGTAVTLLAPNWRLVNLRYGALPPETVISPRVAPQMIGMGLLEAIPEADILAGADLEDRDGDGISGRVRQVRDLESGRIVHARFGWKSSTPSVAVQSATAFSNDMGIASPLLPQPYGDCTEAQAACRAAPHGGDDGTTLEIGKKLFDLVVFYAQNLAVPARRGLDDPKVLAGKKLFYDSGCASCHMPKFVTRRLADRPEQSFQLIWPYTDLLLHDMGEGLADRRVDGAIADREWRTPPLWGIGLTKDVNGHTRFLHDGRARNLMEAVLWHGGEAEAARKRVLAMSKEERETLIAFLESL